MEVYLTIILVHIGLFLLLCLFYNCLGGLVGSIYSLSKYIGLFIAKVFIGYYRSYRSIPIKEYL